MATIAFDLDETLGRFSTPAIHLTYLYPQSYYAYQAKAWEPFEPSADLQKKMDAALTQFAICLANDEEGKKVLRPGILPIIKKLADAKDAGLVKHIIVYSNNGNLNCLRLATRMIEFLLDKPNIFCDHIHFFNPIRRNGDNPNFSNPGQANKTWRVFKQIFSQGCAATEPIVPEKSYFFDDTMHFDLYAQLGPRYFAVNPYKKDIPFEPIDRCFEAALKSQGLDTNDEYFRYLKPILAGKPLTLEGVMSFLTDQNRGYRLANLPYTDDTDSILARLETDFPIPVPAVSAPAPVQAPVLNTVGRVPFNVGSSGNSGRPNVPFFGGKSRRNRRKRRSTKRNRKSKRGTRKN